MVAPCPFFEWNLGSSTLGDDPSLTLPPLLIFVPSFFYPPCVVELYGTKTHLGFLPVGR